MTRQPSRRRHSFLKSRPSAFSSFARNVFLVASTSRSSTKLKQLSSSKLDKNVRSKSQGIGFDKYTPKEKVECSESSSEEENGGTVQLDFDFFSLKPEDFHGVKVLLQTYLDDKQWDLSGFVDLIVGQTTVGTVVKVEDEEDENDDCLYSVVTALNLERYKNHKSIKEIKDFLLEVCDEKDVLGDLRMLLDQQAKNVGLLVSRHVVNFPPELLPPLYSALFDEVAQAAKDERRYFSFKVYLLVTRIYKHKKAGKRKGTLKSCSDDPIIYVWPEDEIFHKLSSWSFTFPLRSRQTDEVCLNLVNIL
ncbi:BCP1 family [Macleaya cordata]|uniref:Protein BCCIP homolog n=1 Tax=Macleaya cordata TaxID=56857 RepID=A0A200PTF1_MACCD|nr:BCP1 family [Macleaya cordata]